MKKYELTNETITIYNGKILHRIRALIDIDAIRVKIGDLGGYIEKEENLSHCGNAWVYGDAMVYDNTWIYGDAEINKITHVFTIGPIGSRNSTITLFRTKENIIKVKCGCFYGTIDEFLAKVELTHGNNKHGQVYRIAAELAKAQIDLE